MKAFEPHRALRFGAAVLAVYASAVAASRATPYYSGYSTPYNVGTVGTTELAAPALQYQESANFHFRTTRTAGTNHGVYAKFATSGGNGYVINLYRGELRIGTTDAYEAAMKGAGWLYNIGDTLSYYGYTAEVSPGVAAAILPLQGLPPGDYTVKVSRSGLVGTTGGYQMGFQFAGVTSGGTGGSTGGGSTGSAASLDAGRDGVLPAAKTDRITYESPTQGTTYSQTPEIRVRVKSRGMSPITSMLVQLDENGDTHNLVNWQTGQLVSFTQENVNRSGFTYRKDWDWLNTGTYALPRPSLPPGNYQVVSFGEAANWGVPIGDGRVSFRVEPPGTVVQPPTNSGSITLSYITSGQLYSSVPRFDGSVTSTGATQVAAQVVRMNTAGAPDGQWNWNRAAFDSYSASQAVEYLTTAPVAGTARTFDLREPALPRGTYALVVYATDANHVVLTQRAVKFAVSGGAPLRAAKDAYTGTITLPDAS
jgi:hypothetical protein